jgi:hypothetical protein
MIAVLYNVACFYSTIGEPDRAMDLRAHQRDA